MIAKKALSADLLRRRLKRNVHAACGGVNAELSCALPICPRRKRREQIVGADKIACITSHFVPVIQAILQLNSALALRITGGLNGLNRNSSSNI